MNVRSMNVAVVIMSVITFIKTKRCVKIVGETSDNVGLGLIELTLIIIEIKSNFSRGPNAVIAQLTLTRLVTLVRLFGGI